MVNLRIVSQVVAGGEPGPVGKSAYQAAVDNGFIGTEQEWLDSLLPFKGWFNSANNLNAKIPNPLVGDYAYVYVSGSSATYIYYCLNKGSWTNSNKTIDTSYVQTFATGQAVSATGIAEDFSGDTSDEYLVRKGVLEGLIEIRSCPTQGNVNAKVVTGLSPVAGVSFKVVMEHAHTGASTQTQVTLTVGNTTARISWEGGNVTSANTWSDGEIIEVFYNSNVFYAKRIFGTFKTGQLLNSVGIDSTPTGNSPNLLTSGGAKASFDSLKGEIDQLESSKANKDGYYSQLTAGSAENLVGQTVDSEAYLIRPTAGAENEIANGVASVLGMEGNSVVWNQLLKQGKLVDMGLPSGVLWATCNIDITQEDGFAASPFQYGCTMFSWGNVEGHNTPASGTTFDYNWGSVNSEEPWYEGQVYGSTPGAALVSNIVANDSQDAARKNVGSLFKMPTTAEFAELLAGSIYIDATGTEIPAGTTDKRVTVNGILGLYLQSKTNGNRLFFACSGYGIGTSWDYRGTYGYYWSASFNSARNARYLYFSNSGVHPQGINSRFFGFVVRAVINPNTVDTGHNNHKYYVDKNTIINLTLLNHSNIAPSSTDAAVVKEKIAQLVGVKPNYAYNAGTILSAQTLGIKTYGQNLLNPTTKQAKLIPYTWVENGTTYSNQYTIKNIPSGATATFTPDNTGVAETVDISGGSLDITSYGSGVLELSASTAKTYVCMKWNTEKDNDVVPYEDHTYNFDVRNIYGKVNGEGEYIQCYTDGMKSAGSIHDTLDIGKALSRLNIVDLGTLNWTYNSSENYFWTQINNMFPVAYEVPIVAICSTYKVVSAAVGRSSDKVVFNFNNDALKELILKDSALSSSDIVGGKIAKLNGVKLCYRTNPTITYTDLVYRDGGIDRPLGDVLMNITVNNWSMEEQLMTPYEDGNPTSIPATIKTQYGMDAVEAIDTLQKASYFADDVHANLQALLTCINTNCAATLGGTFSVSDTATDKVFAFSFTPNVEPTNEGE